MAVLGFSWASHFHRWKAVKWSCHHVAVLIVSDRAGYLHTGGAPRRSYRMPAAAANRDGWQCTNTAYLHSYQDVYCVSPVHSHLQTAAVSDCPVRTFQKTTGISFTN